MANTTLTFIRSRHDTLRALTFATAFACATVSAHAQLPDPRRTPGAINPDVTQENIGSTICVRGWTRTVRPPEDYTQTLKREQISLYGYQDQDLRNYEEDHLIPLELGGAPTDLRNLWPQPHDAPDGWGSYAKDQLEHRLRELVCSGALPLDQARTAIAKDWVAAYRQYVGAQPAAAGSGYTPHSFGYGVTPYRHHFHYSQRPNNG